MECIRIITGALDCARRERCRTWAWRREPWTGGSGIADHRFCLGILLRDSSWCGFSQLVVVPLSFARERCESALRQRRLTLESFSGLDGRRRRGQDPSIGGAEER